MQQLSQKGKSEKNQKSTDERIIREQDYADDMSRPVDFKEDAPEFIDDINPAKNEINTGRIIEEDGHDFKD